MSISSRDIEKFLPGVITGLIVITTTAVLLFLSIDTDRPPNARINNSSEIVYIGDPLLFDGSSSSDPEGRSLHFSWTINETMFTSQPVFYYSFPTPGNFTVVLEVTDTGGHSDIETVIIEVRDG